MHSTLRTLGLLSLFPMLSVVACDSKDEAPERPRGGAGFEDSMTQFFEFECGCLGEIEGPTAEAECLSEIDDALGGTDDVGDCIDAALASFPEAQAPFDCLLDAQYDMLACSSAAGCPGVFVCASGESVPEGWICDGEPDCAGAEDEAQSCPAPHICGSGEQVPSAWVCDGAADCEDGSDEPDDCAPSCERDAELAFEACAPLPEAFEVQVVETCFPGQDSDPGCGEEGCEVPPVCEDDGGCSEPVEGPGVTVRASAPSRRRVAIQAARHRMRAR